MSAVGQCGSHDDVRWRPPPHRNREALRIEAEAEAWRIRIQTIREVFSIQQDLTADRLNLESQCGKFSFRYAGVNENFVLVVAPLTVTAPSQSLRIAANLTDGSRDRERFSELSRTALCGRR